MNRNYYLEGNLDKFENQDDFIGLDWTGLDWTGLATTGLATHNTKVGYSREAWMYR